MPWLATLWLSETLRGVAVLSGQLMCWSSSIVQRSPASPASESLTSGKGTRLRGTPARTENCRRHRHQGRTCALLPAPTGPVIAGCSPRFTPVRDRELICGEKTSCTPPTSIRRAEAHCRSARPTLRRGTPCAGAGRQLERFVTQDRRRGSGGREPGAPPRPPAPARPPKPSRAAPDSSPAAARRPPPGWRRCGSGLSLLPRR